MTDEAAREDAPKRTTWDALAVFLERRSLVMLALGFAAGLPNLLIFDTLSAWLRQAGIPLATITLLSLATLSYSLKFLWAPLIDRTSIPGLTQMLGHRRSWMLVAQGVIILGLWLVSGSNPAGGLAVVALLATLVAFSSATQDIVIDAWRIEAAGDERQGAMAAMYQWGYRVAILTAGIAPLLIADNWSWSSAYAAMAALMGVGIVAVLLAPKEKPRPAMPPLLPDDMPAKPAPEAVEWIARLAILLIGAFLFGAGFTARFEMITWGGGLIGLGADSLTGFQGAWDAKPWGVFLQVAFAIVGLALMIAAAWPMPGRTTRPGVYFVRSYGEPIRDFFARFPNTAGLILAMICCYRLSDFVLNIMNPFYIDVGFDLTTIAEVRKGFGVIMLMLGVGVAGWSIARFGLMKSLIAGALAGPISNLAFAWLATQGPNWQAFAAAIMIDNVTAGYSGTVLIAYMSSLTSAGFTATQYALFSSLYALPGKLISAHSGGIVEASARASEAGGPFAALQGLFTGLPAESFSKGAGEMGVSPAALASGYVVFFVYSCLIGIAALGLAVIIWRKQAPDHPPTEEPAPA